MQSICPVCKKIASAAYNLRGGSVFFDIKCEEHGIFSSLASEYPEDFKRWTSYESICVPPRTVITRGAGIAEGEVGAPAPVEQPTTECPLHCGVCEQHLMTACCVLIDVTSRCNQHCPWCFARAGEETTPDPSLSEISAWYDMLLELGEERPFNIQISGGEPTVRDDLAEIIKAGRDKGFEYIQLNTNGRRIALEEGYAKGLAAVGLSTVFLQFDGLTDSIHEIMRGEPLSGIKLDAIDACRAAGLPVTLVPTVVKDVNVHEIGDLIRFVIENSSVVKGIHFQPASFFGRTPLNVPEPEPGNPKRLSGGRPGTDRSIASIPSTGLGCSRPTPCEQTPPETVPGSPAPSFCPDNRSGFPGSGSGVCRVDCAGGQAGVGRVTMFEVMRQIEAQTGGLISASDLVPITTGHPLCCFCADFLIEKDGSVTPLTTQAQKDEGNTCCCEAVPAERTREAELEIIRRDRDFVLRKWVSSEPVDSAFVGPGVISPQADVSFANDPALSLDEAVDYIRRNTFTISGMAFMDESNLDADRLRRCRVQQFTPDGRLIPFCAYNTLYR